MFSFELCHIFTITVIHSFLSDKDCSLNCEARDSGIVTVSCVVCWQAAGIQHPGRPGPPCPPESVIEWSFSRCQPLLKERSRRVSTVQYSDHVMQTALEPCRVHSCQERGGKWQRKSQRRFFWIQLDQFWFITLVKYFRVLLSITFRLTYAVLVAFLLLLIVYK